MTNYTDKEVVEKASLIVAASVAEASQHALRATTAKAMRQAEARLGLVNKTVTSEVSAEVYQDAWKAEKGALLREGNDASIRAAATLAKSKVDHIVAAGAHNSLIDHLSQSTGEMLGELQHDATV